MQKRTQAGGWRVMVGIVGAALCLAGACAPGTAPSGSESAPMPEAPVAPQVDVTGEWEGWYALANNLERGEGRVDFEFVQTGNNVVVVGAETTYGLVSGNQLWLQFDDGLISGTVEGDSMTLRGQITIEDSTFVYEARLER